MCRANQTRRAHVCYIKISLGFPGIDLAQKTQGCEVFCSQNFRFRGEQYGFFESPPQGSMTCMALRLARGESGPASTRSLRSSEKLPRRLCQLAITEVTNAFIKSKYHLHR